MKLVTKLPSIDLDKCVGCGTCARICTTLAITMVDRKPQVDLDLCMGCGNCEQRCPEEAIKMEGMKEPRKVGIEIDNYSEEICALCRAAKFNPEQIVCICTGTRAGEVAAAILEGCKTPEEIAARTGVRTGCKVLCIEPVIRLLLAADVKLERPKGIQWCGPSPNLWTLEDEVAEKHRKTGYRLKDDKQHLEKLSQSCKGVAENDK